MAQGDKTLKGTFWIDGMRIRLQAPVTNVGTVKDGACLPPSSERQARPHPAAKSPPSRLALPYRLLRSA